VNIPTDWTFKSSEVAATFDRHVRETLPWYDLATGMVAHIARHYIGEQGLVYDIGASTGNIGTALASTLVARNTRLVAIEASEQMAKLYAGPGELVVADARDVVFEPFDVAIAFLVFMFLPVADRAPLLDRLAARVKPGGAIIIVDKEEQPAGYLGTILHRVTLAGKLATGISAADILAKELSLEGVQRPLPAGFPPGGREVFRFGEFVGWVIAGG
jgi:tRNA (cmo5U34)-methyltransferase